MRLIRLIAFAPFVICEMLPAFADIVQPPAFVIPSNAKALPLSGPKAWCRQSAVIRGILQSLSDTQAVRNAGETVIDFVDSTTLSVDPTAKTFACHGIVHVSNGQMLPGTYSIYNNAAGESMWNWVNDDPSTNKSQSSGDKQPSDTSRWTKVSSNSAATEYVDQADAVRSGTTATIWFMQDMKLFRAQNGDEVSDGAPGKEFRSVKFQVEFDCETDRYRALFYGTFADHMGRGTLVDGGPTNPSDSIASWQSVPSDMENGRVIACAR